MGMIFDIQRCSYQDGPGIRTTVFFKGCPLRCAWCHNPESFSPKPQLQFFSEKCVGCLRCGEVCPQGVHRLGAAGHAVDFSKCIACGRCAQVCPENALSIVGREASAQEIMDIVRRDKPFYAASGGGMTVSGGEPTAQSEFLAQLLTLARQEEIHTCVETNGYIPARVLSRIAPLTDLFLIDYKLSQEEGLTPYTHASGNTWRSAMDYLTRIGKSVILRLPVIPGINDSAGHFRQAAAIRKAHPNVERIEIMPYHSIGRAKWEQLGYAYSLPHLATVESSQAEAWRETLRQCEAELGLV